jgi:hypothetical protein
MATAVMEGRWAVAELPQKLRWWAGELDRNNQPWRRELADLVKAVRVAAAAPAGQSPAYLLQLHNMAAALFQPFDNHPALGYLREFDLEIQEGLDFVAGKTVA